MASIESRKSSLLRIATVFGSTGSTLTGQSAAPCCPLGFARVTLVLLARGDLGRGGELTIIHGALADRGIHMEVSTPPSKAKKPRGRPKKFEPTEEHDKELLRLWRDPVLYTVAYVVQRAADMGYTNDRNALNYRYKKRSGGNS